MESSKTLCHCRCRNHRRKQSHCRTRIHHWKLSDRWCMESIAKTNSRWTHEISRENRVMVDSCNWQWKQHHYWPEIVSENRVPVDLGIVNEYWVTAAVWNRQRHWIHDRRIKSIAKIDPWLMHGIVKNVMSVLIHKSGAKAESLQTKKSSLKT